MNPVVLEVAAKVRKEIKKWAEELPRTWEITPSDLAGCCGIASYMLKNTLAKLGIESTFVMGHFSLSGIHEDWELERTNHCWLVVQGQIVDITATQFGIEDEVYTPVYTDSYYPIKPEQEAIRYLLKSWSGQSPSNYADDMAKIQHKLHTNLQAVP